MNKELESLLQQQAEIKRRIREIKMQGQLSVGCAKIDFEHYPTMKEDRWYIAICLRDDREDGDKSRYRSVINGRSREEAISHIPEVIRDLQGLYDALTKGVEDNGEE